ncbi:hypothetical protein [Maritimibacter fusiformis]|uniref:Uncharacterized protein n=1 Tax=Maritimibacter fusiformis TaxID=2603819 RepID=A0A5D0RLQ3_9RHOB|nr:hypothetical protein [Maritimibacter fusiformis]TYB81765.1 hypothetical protein FVF75_08655 [Maritimibacter fusiformis]
MILERLSKSLKKSRSAIADVHGGLGEIRSRIDELRDQRDAIESRPLPLASVEREVDAWLDTTVANAVTALPVNRFATPKERRRGEPDFELPLPLRHGANTPDAGPAVGILLGLLVATNREAFKMILLGRLGDYYENREGIEPSAAADLISEIDNEIWSLEHDEEFLIRDAEAAGLELQRRPDANPEIVLLADSEQAT